MRQQSSPVKLTIISDLYLSYVHTSGLEIYFSVPLYILETEEWWLHFFPLTEVMTNYSTTCEKVIWKWHFFHRVAFVFLTESIL